MSGSAGGRSTGTLIDLPSAPSATVIAMHGFTRAPIHLTALAHACATAGLACIRPALAPRWAPVLMARPTHLDDAADGLIGNLETLPSPVVVVGHSAGAAAACWIAARWSRQSTGPDDLTAGPRVAGIVLVDGVEAVTGLIRRSLPDLADVPMTALTADPGPCNRHGALARFLEEARPGVVVRLPGSCHGDIEGEDRAIYRLACREQSTERMRRQVIDRTVETALRMIS